jgi:hypothetical protein
MRLARLALATLLLAVLAPLADAQGVLDGQWIKLKVKAKGFTIDGGGVVAKASYTTVVYLNLTADGSLYDYSITYEDQPDEWLTTTLETMSPTGEDSNVVVNQSLTIPGLAELVLQTTFRFKFKLDAQDALKKATLKSDSGHIVTGTLNGLQFFGSVTLTGTTIPPEKLPFAN